MMGRLPAFILLLLSTRAGAAEPCRFLLLPGAFDQSSLVGRWVLQEGAYFATYRARLVSRGCEVEQMQFPADSTIEQRAMLIRNRIEERGPFHVIAHSQAGLDLRFAFKTLGLKPAQVRSVTSIGTPHSGSRVAEWALGHQRRRSLLYRALWIFGYDLAALRFLPEMDASFLREKAAYFSAEPPVPWFYPEVSCRTQCHWFFRLLGKLVGSGDGDGMVEASSQVFGRLIGSFDLDHLSEIADGGSRVSERERLISAVLDAVLGAPTP